MKDTYRFLHFSDLHFYDMSGFDTDRAWNRLLKYIDEIVSANKANFDMLILSGDTFYHGEGDTEALKERIEDLYEKAGIRDDKKPRQIVYCPGNHDFNRNDDDRKRCLTSVLERSNPSNDTDNYRKLKLDQKEISELFSLPFGQLFHTFRSIVYDKRTEIDYPAFCVRVQDFPVTFVSINTAFSAGQELESKEVEKRYNAITEEHKKQCKDKNQREMVRKYRERIRYLFARGGKMRIVEDEGKLLGPTEETINKIARNLEAETDYRSRIVIAVGHHGINMFCGEGKERMRTLFERIRCNMYLCGHVHKPTMGFAARGNGRDRNDVREFVAGSMLLDGYSIPSFYEGTIKLGRAKATIEMRLHTYLSIANDDDQDCSTWALETHFMSGGVESFVIFLRSFGRSSGVEKKPEDLSKQKMRDPDAELLEPKREDEQKRKGRSNDICND
ncbi:MAG: metallophosphoesterase [Oscillospiraceae bacterium]|jgi:UDP-2,3-diacylglucosamine pyrophosphatase LpxH|nr:metallophosphoesterase [Oscillospiraceae bacterium]